MHPSLKVALTAVDVDEQIERATLHAEFRIREFIWAGHRPKGDIKEQDVTVAGLGAGDFAFLALQRFTNEVRKYDEARSFLDNLKSAIDSIIWSAKKAQDLNPTVDYRLEFDGNGNAIDPISSSEEETLSVSDAIVREEVVKDQEEHYKNLFNSYDGDEDVQDYLEALKAEIYKPQDIADLTGIEVRRVYEIRKMLKKDAPKFFGVLNYRELERKVTDGI